MEFLVFLSVYVVRRRLDKANLFENEVFWRRLFAPACKVSPGKEAGLGRGLLIVAVPALLLGLGEVLLQDTGWWLFVHLSAFLILLGLMGMPGIGNILAEYTDAWRRGDMQSAWRHVLELLPAEERGAASSPEYMHRALSGTVIQLIFERYFVVAFWYVVAGVGGAFAARALIALRDQWPHAAARPGFGRLANALNYLPARLLSLTFGIAGDLAGWLKGGRSAALSFSADNKQTLIAAANSSLTSYELDPERFSRVHAEDWPDFGDRSLMAIRGLMNRSMLVWICGLALLVIAGIV